MVVVAGVMARVQARRVFGFKGVDGWVAWKVVIVRHAAPALVSVAVLAGAAAAAAAVVAVPEVGACYVPDEASDGLCGVFAFLHNGVAWAEGWTLAV